MSEGTVCLRCRKYFPQSCVCDHPIPSEDGVTPSGAAETRPKRGRLPTAALLGIAALALSVPEGPRPFRKPGKARPSPFQAEARRQRKAKRRAARKSRALNRKRS